MSRRLLIEAGAFETRTALTEGGEAVEFQVFPVGAACLLGEIRLGRIVATEAALGAFFIDIGLDRPAFLKRKDAPGAREGDALAVEVIREAEGGKAARVSARIAPGTLPDLAGRQPPALLRPAPPAALRLAAARAPDRITVAGEAAAPLLALLRRALPAVPVEVAHGTSDLFAAEGLADAFAASLRPRLPLVPTGAITIAETEALTAIDIDGGGLGARAANEAGARAAAAEIRRRNLSGQIVVDFIGDAPAIAAGRQMLIRALAADPLRPEVIRGDLNGLVLVTRPRQGDSLSRAVTVPCPIAEGRWLAPRHLAAELCRLADGLAHHHPGKALQALVPADVAAYLESPAAAPGLDALRRRLGAPLVIATAPPAPDPDRAPKVRIVP
ncbi:ribonuclease E/G [Zavarzinia compransoris]|uniref:RNA-binding protein AU-1/Ribonuclease E/G domain-containing protein n=1 Tax=Zavarzinia compransoris TaxID=1264899 RepID=A0A317DWF4_9PROT|nr:ribonuclease E/G [Zavarzinia compransoris]PWR18674.1 hypothetical protein DKG75_16905 [Zavarzinia compransoris]TDP48648.1 ribonuclease E/G family protein [Zavarzinia compransoris]